MSESTGLYGLIVDATKALKRKAAKPATKPARAVKTTAATAQPVTKAATTAPAPAPAVQATASPATPPKYTPADLAREVALAESILSAKNLTMTMTMTMTMTTTPTRTRAHSINALSASKTTGSVNGDRVASPYATTKLPGATTTKHAPDPFKAHVSHEDAYTDAIIESDWKLDVSTPASLALVKGTQRLHVDLITYGLRDWLATARGYHPSDSVFAEMASKVKLDVLSALPKTASLFPA